MEYSNLFIERDRLTGCNYDNIIIIRSIKLLHETIHGETILTLYVIAIFANWLSYRMKNNNYMAHKIELRGMKKNSLVFHFRTPNEQ